VFITFLKTKISTKPIKNMEERLIKHHFKIIEEKNYLYDSLKMFRVKKERKKTEL
jgi:hypothetical protein